MRFAVELQVLVDKLFRLWYWFCRHYCCLPRPFRSSVHCNFVIFKLSQERVPQIISLVGWHDIRRGKSTSGEKTWYNQSQYLWNEELTEVVSFIWPGVVWIILVCECSPELTLLRGGGWCKFASPSIFSLILPRHKYAHAQNFLTFIIWTSFLIM